MMLLMRTMMMMLMMLLLLLLLLLPRLLRWLWRCDCHAIGTQRLRAVVPETIGASVTVPIAPRCYRIPSRRASEPYVANGRTIAASGIPLIVAAIIARS